MLPSLAHLLKLAGRSVGLEISRFSRTPSATLLSLRNMPIRAIVDVGANEGQFAKMIFPFFPRATIIAFEPQQDAFEVLNRWAATVHGQVKCYNRAVGEMNGQVVMHKHVNHYSSSSILKSTEAHTALAPTSAKQTPIPVEMVTLDSFFSESDSAMSGEFLVKMDVQGYEDRVIAGGQETLRRARACIVEVCLDGLYEEQARFEHIVVKCAQLGLRYRGNLAQSCAADGRVQVIDAVFIREPR